MQTSKLNSLFEMLTNELPTPKELYTTHQLVDVTPLEDGKQEVTINTSGHNPKNIKVEVTEEEILVKAKKDEGTSRFVKDIDLSLSLGTDYDGTKSTAKFENGLLVLTIDKKKERKAKEIKITY